MPADNAKFVVEFQAQMAQMRKAFREYAQLQKKFEKNITKFSKSQDKSQAEDFKQAKQLHRVKEREQNRELGRLTKMNRARKKQQDVETKHHKGIAQATDQAQEKQRRGMKRMLQDFQRSPTGRFLMGRRAGVRRAAGGAVRAGAGLAGGLAGMLVGAGITGYQRMVQYETALGQASGLAGGRQVRAGRRGAMGARLGFNMIETAQQIPMMARATGETGPREMQQAMRATGMQGGEVAGLFGTLRRGGQDFAGAGPGRQSRGGRQFQRMIAAGMESGLERARLPEFFTGIQKVMEEQQRVRVGEVGADTYAKTLAMWGKTGLAGMQGMRGASILNRVEQGIRKPGGGEAGKALMMQAMGFGKPGGGTSFYQAEKMREKGATGENIMAVMTEVKKQFGTGEEAALTLRELFGVSLEQAEELIKIYGSEKSVEEKQKEIDKKMDESKSLEQQSLDMFKSMNTRLGRIAGRFNKMIGYGYRSAEAIEAVEDIQFKVLDFLFDIAENIKELVTEIKFLVDLQGGTSAEDRRNIEESRKLRKQAREGRTYDERIEMAERAQDVAKRRGAGPGAVQKSIMLGRNVAREGVGAGIGETQIQAKMGKAQAEQDLYESQMRGRGEEAFQRQMRARGVEYDPNNPVHRRASQRAGAERLRLQNLENKGKLERSAEMEFLAGVSPHTPESYEYSASGRAASDIRRGKNLRYGVGETGATEATELVRAGKPVYGDYRDEENLAVIRERPDDAGVNAGAGSAGQGRVKKRGRQ